MDEVLLHALVVREGEPIFKKADMSLPLPPPAGPQQERAVN
jgi:hypothetical protein